MVKKNIFSLSSLRFFIFSMHPQPFLALFIRAKKLYFYKSKISKLINFSINF